MSTSTKWGQRSGLALHVLIGGLMVLGGAAKLLGFFPAEHFETLGLAGRAHLIGAGEFMSALLLLIPRTTSLGVLVTSAFWGGAICIHMGHGEPFGFQSVLLALTWLGAYLRVPAVFSSFQGPHAKLSPRGARARVPEEVHEAIS
jgi:hypothetical protein